VLKVSFGKKILPAAHPTEFGRTDSDGDNSQANRGKRRGMGGNNMHGTQKVTPRGSVNNFRVTERHGKGGVSVVAG